MILQGSLTRSKTSLLLQSFCQVSVHKHREYDDQSRNQLGPEACQAGRHRGGLDSAKDESSEEGS
jgi:hypothetical protein